MRPGFPNSNFKITDGSDNINTYWRYVRTEFAPALDYDDVEFVALDWGYPSNFTIDGSVMIAQNGVRVDGGANFEFYPTILVDHRGNVFYFGAGLIGPANVHFQRADRNMVIECAPGVSQHVVLDCDSKINEFLPDNQWTLYRTRKLAVDRSRSNTTFVLVGQASEFPMDANETWDFCWVLNYNTTALADFKYTIIFTAAPTSFRLTRMHKAPGSPIFTTVAGTENLTETSIPAGGWSVGGHRRRLWNGDHLRSHRQQRDG